MFELTKEIILPVNRQELWDFVATPRNLDQITPPELEFEILSDIPEQMFEGLEISYRIRIPVFGKRTWLTRISQLKPGFSFVDEQISGPYRFWRHLHQLQDLDINNCLMKDFVEYKLPYSVAGTLAHSLLVRKQLDRIFSYRSEKLMQLFGAGKTIL